MKFASMEAIADAVLFEGYILYPYRPSALKNRQRWNFGTLYPRVFAEAQTPQERWQFRAEVLLRADISTRLNARVRFLQLTPPETGSEDDWAEGFPRSRTVEDIGMNDLLRGVEQDFNLDAVTEEERRIIPSSFRHEARIGRLNLRAELLHDDLYQVAAAFANLSPSPTTSSSSRRLVQTTAFTSAHLMLEAEDGAFVSLLEPDSNAEVDAKACTQDGVFPVLAGETSDRGHILCSPIILYDYPEVAPESAGDFFDGAEMDEMLALRVLTLTDQEKEEMRRGDRHARAILERTESLPDEQLARVHGAIRSLRPFADEISAAKAIDLVELPFDPFAEQKPIETVRVFGVELRIGDRVRLWPQKKADILDIEMEGKIAIIEAIEQDFENNLQFAVVLEDDPGRDLGMLRQAGHRFFFSPEEVEPVGLEMA
jgi:hypothetical protein